MMRQLAPNPIAELRSVPFSEYVHGTFFYDPSKRFILVQVLNTIELAIRGEIRPAPRVVISIDPRRLKVTGARAVWPAEKELPVMLERGNGGMKNEVVLENPPRYTALYLRLA